MTLDAPLRACDFRDSLDALNAAGVKVVGISPRQAREAREVPGARRAHVPTHQRSRSRRAGGVRRLGRRTSTARSTSASSGRPSLINGDGKINRPCTTSRPRATWPNCATSWGLAGRGWSARLGLWTQRVCGIGRRAGFRFLCLRTWEFKSPTRTTVLPTRSTPSSHPPRAPPAHIPAPWRTASRRHLTVGSPRRPRAGPRSGHPRQRRLEPPSRSGTSAPNATTRRARWHRQ